jgi:hypothetical protein
MMSDRPKMKIPKSICVEAETPGDTATSFRLSIDGKTIALNLTAVQAHLLVGEILEKIVLPKKSGA